MKRRILSIVALMLLMTSLLVMPASAAVGLEMVVTASAVVGFMIVTAAAVVGLLPVLGAAAVMMWVGVCPPAAVISGGNSPDPMTVRGTLGDIAETAREVKAPAVIVVGEVVNILSGL